MSPFIIHLIQDSTTYNNAHLRAACLGSQCRHLRAKHTQQTAAMLMQRCEGSMVATRRPAHHCGSPRDIQGRLSPPSQIKLFD